MTSGSLSEAEELRKAKKYAEAEPIFRQAWERRKHPDVGWRLAHCLRHNRKPAEAIKICEFLLEEHPDDIMVRREAVWAVYLGQLRPAVDASDLGRAAAAANRMVALGADDLALRRAVFSVVKVAKGRRAWREIIDWTDKLEPAELDRNPRKLQDQTLMPELEQWYFGRIKALIELRLWTGARETAEAALKAYPGHRDFGRWAAIARAALGEPEEALEEMRELTRRERAPYMLDTLASIAEEVGETDEAYQACCMSLSAHGKLQTKIRTIERLARLALLRNQAETAARNAALALAIREREGWSIRIELEDLLDRAQEASGVAAPPKNFDTLLAACKGDWSAGRQQPDGEADGIVAALPEGRPFCFIRTESGQDIFTSRDLLPPNAQHKGTRVRVWWVEAFDRKKNRPSFRAVRVERLTPRRETSSTDGSSPAEDDASEPQTDDGFRLDL